MHNSETFIITYNNAVLGVMVKDKELQYFDYNKINMDVIEDFCRQIYYCDPYTAMHAEHVADLMAGLASQMLMPSKEISLAYLVGIVHDVGKIKIPEHILTKSGRLTDAEYEIMKRHSVEGAEMLQALDGAESVALIMRYHHERYDGSGYPDGLKGEETPLFSKMLAVCDAFDAMTTNRCYRQPISLAESLIEIKRCAGTHFDPKIAAAFLVFIKERFGFSIDE